MVIRTAIVAAKLIRMEMAAVPFLAVFVPLGILTRDLREAFLYALPLLLAFLSGYTINNLHDIEKDRVNHPNRPLPSGAISVSVAAAIFFLLLAATLLSIKLFVPTASAYLFLLMLIGLVNYNYVVLYFPYAKNLFMALIGTIPLLILFRAPGGPILKPNLLPALFLFLLGMEMLSDTIDIKGDGQTFANLVGAVRATPLGFLVKLLADLTVAVGAYDRIGIVIVGVLFASDAVAWYQWKYVDQRQLILQLLGFQLAISLYFLVH